MSQFLQTILIIIGTWLLKSFSDWWVKHSKLTENTIDDFLANNFKLVIDKLTGIFNIKKK